MPWQLCGYGRSDWSTKLIRGLTSEAPAGFRSRRGPSHDSTLVTPHNAPFSTYKACFAHFAVVIEYREQEQITELRLPQDIIAKLAFEAEFRGIRIGGLIGAIIAAIMKKDLLPLILDTEEDTKNPQTVAGTEIRVGSGHFEA